MKRARQAALLMLLPAALLAGCAPEPEETSDSAERVVVTVKPAHRGTIRDAVRATGTIAPAPGAELMITAPLSARIAVMPQAEGDHVRAGDLLVSFEIPSLKADVAAKQSGVTRAGARREAAQAAATRAESLLNRGIASRREVEEAHRDLAEAEAEHAEAEASLQAVLQLRQRETVTAPFAGVVARRWHNPGDLVEPSGSDPILRLIDPSRLEAEISIPVGDLPRVQIGAAAEVIGPGSFAAEAARVRTGPAAVDPATGAAIVRLSFAQPTRLPAGTPVQVVVYGEARRDALLVAEEAVLHEGGESFVVTVDGELRARRRKVETGIAGGGEIEILSGLDPADRIVVQGQEALPDGAPVALSGS